jgi:hypothetical protein
MLIKTIVLLVFLLILASLGTALFTFLKDKGDSTRTVKALTLRIGLSISLFILLMIGYAIGWIQPHGIQ